MSVPAPPPLPTREDGLWSTKRARMMSKPAFERLSPRTGGTVRGPLSTWSGNSCGSRFQTVRPLLNESEGTSLPHPPRKKRILFLICRGEVDVRSGGRRDEGKWLDGWVARRGDPARPESGSFGRGRTGKRRDRSHPESHRPSSEYPREDTIRVLPRASRR